MDPKGQCLVPIFINKWSPMLRKVKGLSFCRWHCHLPYNKIWEQLLAITIWICNFSLEKWESDWCMEFNPSKCNIIRVTRRCTPFKFQYKLHGKDLETVDTTKYLGINLSHDLGWNDHVNEITNNWTFYAAISALVWPNPKNEHTKLIWDPLLNTVPLSGTLT